MKSAKNELNSLAAPGRGQDLDPPYNCVPGHVSACAPSLGEKGHTSDGILEGYVNKTFFLKQLQT